MYIYYKQKLSLLMCLPLSRVLSCLFFESFESGPINFIIPKDSNYYYYIDDISKVKLATIVEGDPKAPFSIATTPRCRGGRYSIPWIAPLYP